MHLNLNTLVEGRKTVDDLKNSDILVPNLSLKPKKVQLVQDCSLKFF